jgi:hypothetical protein
LWLHDGFEVFELCGLPKAVGWLAPQAP